MNNESGSDKKKSATHRRKEREREDNRYLPVIVKRTDESRRHPDDTLEYAIAEGLEQLQRPTVSLVLSSLAAGLILGFTAMSVAVMVNLVSPLGMLPLTRLTAALVYPLAFVMCILSGTQLFTEHTATAVYPVLDRKASILQLVRLWLVVIAGNLVGAGLSACLLTAAEPVIQAREGYVEVARHLVEYKSLPLLVSSVLAGWLMAQGGWLMLRTVHMSGQILSIYVVTFLIGIGGLHHSIAGAAEIFTAEMIDGRYSLEQVCRFLGHALLGNMVGGSLFVAVLNYAHIRGTQVEPEEEGGPE